VFGSRFDFSNVELDRNAVKRLFAIRRSFLGVHRDGDANHASDKRGGRQGVDNI
jgi:hypothetical protein